MIYLLRHGLDDEKYVGGFSKVGLTEEGILKTHTIGKYIKDNIKGINVIYSSDINRAIETANIVNLYLDFEIKYSKIFRELDKGLLTGMLVTEAKEKYKDVYDSLNIDTRYPNGESMRDLYNRVKESLKIISKFDNSLIVTHRGYINMLYFILNDIDLDMNKERFGVSHSSIHQLDIDKKLIKKI